MPAYRTCPLAPGARSQPGDSTLLHLLNRRGLPPHKPVPAIPQLRPVAARRTGAGWTRDRPQPAQLRRLPHPHHPPHGSSRPACRTRRRGHVGERRSSHPSARLVSVGICAAAEMRGSLRQIAVAVASATTHKARAPGVKGPPRVWRLVCRFSRSPLVAPAGGPSCAPRPHPLIPYTAAPGPPTARHTAHPAPPGRRGCPPPPTARRPGPGRGPPDGQTPSGG